MLFGILMGTLTIVTTALLHNAVLLQISALVPRQRLGKHWVTVCVFSLLAGLHTLEIAGFAAVLAALSTWVWPGTLSVTGPVGAADLIYLAGIN